MQWWYLIGICLILESRLAILCQQPRSYRVVHVLPRSPTQLGDLSLEYVRPVIITAAWASLELNHVEAWLSKPKRLSDSCVAHDNEWQERNEGAVRVLGSWRNVLTCRTSVLIPESAVRSYSQIPQTRYSRLDWCLNEPKCRMSSSEGR